MSAEDISEDGREYHYRFDLDLDGVSIKPCLSKTLSNSLNLKIRTVTSPISVSGMISASSFT
jgi:hypothetical protein